MAARTARQTRNGSRSATDTARWPEVLAMRDGNAASTAARTASARSWSARCCCRSSGRSSRRIRQRPRCLVPGRSPRSRRARTARVEQPSTVAASCTESNMGSSKGRRRETDNEEGRRFHHRCDSAPIPPAGHSVPANGHHALHRAASTTVLKSLDSTLYRLGAGRTTRKPMFLSRSPGAYLNRLADQRTRAALFQEPPRRTREAPPTGPVGLDWGPAG